ncbi:MAG TPA: flagellar biosynthesis anti-sigma factor FlgM [Bdellovibrionales bacterium]|nr:flagellar biosynthesis anti-sigma factor FlgM [Pseudobdellovibrionaceae bacterium]HAG90880.1 flagellar biosynthesis anti-sigma factor FlgM [Bdellovibrionales bacterium]|tara:strand:+ start:1320 stop:1634 length:315 start_codon:yes stop_codon:yes gene_type:complete
MKVGNKVNPSVQNLNTNTTDKLNLKSKKEPMSHAEKMGHLKSSSHVDVSERAQMMNKAKQIASQDSIDEAKVARLQKLIDEGRYNVDASAIADRLVDDHLSTME